MTAKPSATWTTTTMVTSSPTTSETFARSISLTTRSLQDGYGSSLRRDPSSGSVNAETSHYSFGRHSASTSFDSIASSIPSQPSLTQIAGFPVLSQLGSPNEILEHFWASLVNHLDGLILHVDQYNAGRFEMAVRLSSILDPQLTGYYRCVHFGQIWYTTETFCRPRRFQL